jgi:hypothetical protein
MLFQPILDPWWAIPSHVWGTLWVTLMCYNILALGNMKHVVHVQSGPQSLYK